MYTLEGQTAEPQAENLLCTIWNFCCGSSNDSRQEGTSEIDFDIEMDDFTREQISQDGYRTPVEDASSVASSDGTQPEVEVEVDGDEEKKEEEIISQGSNDGAQV